MPNQKDGKEPQTPLNGSLASSAGFPFLSSMSRDELEVVLTAVLNDRFLPEHRSRGASSSGEDLSEALPSVQTTLSKDEMERVLAAMAGGAWKLQN